MRLIKALLILIILGGLLLPNEMVAQTYNVALSDSSINNSHKMKMEVLQLREKVKKLQKKVRRLEGNLHSMSKRVKSLNSQNEKSAEEYAEMEEYANHILSSNDSLRSSNQELLVANARIEKSKEAVEVAANALKEVLDRERKVSTERITSLKRNYAQGCTSITHDSKRGTVVLDEDNIHKLSWINDFNLRVETCYALPRDQARQNVKVYFYLFKHDDLDKDAPLESSVPIILTPNMAESDESMIYYQGELIIALPTNNRKKLKTRFFYEVEYQEEIIAYGRFKLD